MQKAVVIGSGVAGLASAIRLRCQGFEVAVFEANPYPGGKLSHFEMGKYRFDAGPSLFTLPELVLDLINLAGKDTDDYFQYDKMDEACRYFWSDGTRLTAWSDKNAFAEEVENKLGESQKNVLNYLKESQELNDATEPFFLRKSLHKINTYLDVKLLPTLFKLPQLHLTSRLHQVNTRRFQSEKLIQLFDRFATYNGSDPYRTPGVMQVIPHLEHNVGTFYPKGGMHSITLALFKLAEDIGVEFSFKSPVEQIVVKKKKAVGIVVKGEEVDANVVVSNADVYSTYRHLMPNQSAPEKVLNHERSSSALIFYWGISKEFPELGLHNIFFSDDYKREFEAIFKENSVGEDPTIYVNITSKYSPEDSPEGGENWFVMINVPGDFGQDWDEITKKLRRAVVNRINSELGVSLEDLIEEEDILDPPLIEQKTSSFRGSLYGSGSNDMLSAFLRHPNFSRKISNLYFSGGSAHPGGGIPLCLLSAEITSELVKKDFGVA